MSEKPSFEDQLDDLTDTSEEDAMVDEIRARERKSREQPLPELPDHEN